MMDYVEEYTMAKIWANFGEVAWSRLMTVDINQAIGFYSALFNWNTVNLNDPNFEYHVFQREGKPVAGLMKAPNGMGDNYWPHWLSFVKVQDLNNTLLNAERLGATIIIRDRRIESLGRFAILMDPAGAYIGIVE